MNTNGDPVGGEPGTSTVAFVSSVKLMLWNATLWLPSVTVALSSPVPVCVVCVRMFGRGKQGAGVAVGVAVGLGVRVTVGVAVELGVRVAVGVAVEVAVGVAVARFPSVSTDPMSHVAEPLLSPSRGRCTPR